MDVWPVFGAYRGLVVIVRGGCKGLEGKSLILVGDFDGIYERV